MTTALLMFTSLHAPWNSARRDTLPCQQGGSSRCSRRGKVVWRSTAASGRYGRPTLAPDALRLEPRGDLREVTALAAYCCVRDSVRRAGPRQGRHLLAPDPRAHANRLPSSTSSSTAGRTARGRGAAGAMRGARTQVATGRGRLVAPRAWAIPCTLAPPQPALAGTPTPVANPKKPLVLRVLTQDCDTTQPTEPRAGVRIHQ
jgi:hypothetical protein